MIHKHIDGLLKKKTNTYSVYVCVYTHTHLYVYLDSYICICSVLLIVFIDRQSRRLCLSHFTLVLAVNERHVTSFFETEDELYPVLLKSEMNTFYYLKEPLY